MTNRLLILLIVLHLTAVAWFHTKIKKSPDPEELGAYSRLISGSRRWQGRVAPNFTATLLNGETFTLSSQIGKQLIVLNFFATWCGPCRAEMPELNSFYGAHRSEGFLLVGIDSGEQPEVVRPFVDELKIHFPVAVDPDKTVTEAYGVGSFPTTVVIGVTGLVQLYDSGQVENADAALAPLLKSNLSLLKTGGAGISQAEYEQLLGSPQAVSRGPPMSSQLAGRPAQIAKVMDCPCGCTRKVFLCGCQTAKRIKAKLHAMPLDGNTDQDIIMALNKEFCVPPWRGDD